MTPFTRHPHRQGLSYFEHFAFAMSIAVRLFASTVAFAIHALMPFIPIRPQLDLEATAARLLERNRFVEASAARTGLRPGTLVSVDGAGRTVAGMQ